MKKVILILVVLANLAFSTEELTQTQIEYLDKECESGDSPICVGLGDSYLFGISGLNKDYKKAKFYFIAAKSTGFDIGEFYEAFLKN